VSYFTPFLILWIVGTIIPIALIGTEIIASFLILVFNPIGYVILMISQFIMPLYITIRLILLTFGQFLTFILYKFLSKKLFKINW